MEVGVNQWLPHTLIICVLTFLNIQGTSEVPITIIEGALAKGAVCLDGSPPAYQFDTGFGESVNNWLVHIQGGGWCNSVDDCRTRTYSQYGSSKKMKSTDYNFTGIMSNKQESNPNFYNWNRVVIRYCDGSSLTGDIEAVDPATNLHFRGARVFNVIMEELLGKGMKSASNALLSGSSAGGLASILHCDKFRAFFPTRTRVKCFSDAGYFAHVKDLSGEYKFEGYYDQIVTLHVHREKREKMKSTDYNFTGIMSNKQESNPNFYNWNRVVIRYCDGSSLTGDIEAVDPATNLHFRGARVFNVIMEELLGKGMKFASNALLSGSSAGGLASILHCDKFRAFFPTSTRVKCFSDAGYFAHVKDLSREYKFEGYYDHIVTLHGSAKNLYPECTSKMKPSLCFYPQFAIPYVQTPVFILHATYDTFQVQNILATPQADPKGLFTKCKQDINACSADQIRRLQDFRSEFLDALSVVGNGSSRGWFVNNCFTHGQCEYQSKWLGNPSSTLNHKAIANAVGDWFYERSTVQMIDNQTVLPHYCTN